MNAKETVRTVQATYDREQERLKLLMDEYHKTLAMIDHSEEKIPNSKANFVVQLPYHKKALVMPIIEEMLRRVD